jgi:hypothetical protein
MSKRGRTKKPHKKSASERAPGPRRSSVPERASIGPGTPERASASPGPVTRRPIAPSILEIVPDPMREPPPVRDGVARVAPVAEAGSPSGAGEALTPAAAIVHDLVPPQAAAPEGGTDRPAREEPSVPPASDLDVHFFDRPPGHDPFEFESDSDPRTARRAMFAAAAPRRARFVKYVQGAVVASIALCVIALLKAALFHGDSTPPARAASIAEPPTVSAALASAAARPAEAPAAPVAVAVADPPAADPAAARVEEAVAAPAPSPSPAEVAAPPAEVAAPAPVASSPAAAAVPAAPAAAAPAAAAPAPPAQPPADPASRAREASRQRETARAALERGALREAISAGERSVALDGTDGESWLILGAAYQQGGDLASARRSFKACVDQGRRGPRGECAQMLR